MEQDRTASGHKHIALMQTQGTHGEADRNREGNQQREGVQVSPMSAAVRNEGDRCAAWRPRAPERDDTLPISSFMLHLCTHQK
jgi:hypothetical protein